MNNHNQKRHDFFSVLNMLAGQYWSIHCLLLLLISRAQVALFKIKDAIEAKRMSFVRLASIYVTSSTDLRRTKRGKKKRFVKDSNNDGNSCVSGFIFNLQ